jgi:hypothetical protein
MKTRNKILLFIAILFAYFLIQTGIGSFLLFSLIGYPFVEGFFFVASRNTGPLIHTALTSTPFLLGMVAVVIFIVWARSRHRSTYSWLEGVMQALFGLIVVLVTTTFLLANSFNIQTSKYQVWPLYGLEFEPASQDANGAGFPASYRLRVGDGGWYPMSVSAEELEAAQAACGAKVSDPSLTTMPSGHTRHILSANEAWRIECETKLPVTVALQSYNFALASRFSILGRQTQLDDLQRLIAEIGLDIHGYPEIKKGSFGETEFERVVNASALTLSEEDVAGAQRLLERAGLTSFYADTPTNPILLIVSTDASSSLVQDAITLAWKAPKATDVLVVVNVSRDTKRVQWVMTLAPTDTPIPLAGIDASIMSLDPFNVVEAADLIVDQLISDTGDVNLSFLNPEEFRYLTAEFSLGLQGWLTLFLVIVISQYLAYRFFIWCNPTSWLNALRCQLLRTRDTLSQNMRPPNRK